MNNLSKAQLIELATSQDIRFKKSWNKQQIIEAINSGIKNSDIATDHPRISRWTTCSLIQKIGIQRVKQLRKAKALIKDL